MPYIYKITNDINNKIYIGKTEFSIEKRFKEHIQDSKKGYINRPLYNAMNKYGIEHFAIELIEDCSQEELSDKEIYYIKYYNSYNNGYNATLGGDGASYLDYDLIINTYKKLGVIKKVAENLGVSEDSIHNILTLYNIPINSTGKINKEKMGIKVKMLNKITRQEIKIFNSYSEAAQYLIDNNLTGCRHNTIRTHISEVCNGIRKSAAGFI